MRTERPAPGTYESAPRRFRYDAGDDADVRATRQRAATHGTCRRRRRRHAAARGDRARTAAPRVRGHVVLRRAGRLARPRDAARRRGGARRDDAGPRRRVALPPAAADAGGADPDALGTRYGARPHPRPGVRRGRLPDEAVRAGGAATRAAAARRAGGTGRAPGLRGCRPRCPPPQGDARRRGDHAHSDRVQAARVLPPQSGDGAQPRRHRAARMGILERRLKRPRRPRRPSAREAGGGRTAAPGADRTRVRIRAPTGGVMSLRLRLTLLYSVLFAVLIGLFGTIVYTQTSKRLYSSVDDTLRTRADRILSAAAASPPQSALRANQSVLDEIASPGVYVEIVDPGGAVVARSRNLTGALPVATRRRPDASGPSFETHETTNDERVRVLYEDLPNGQGAMLVARSLHPTDASLDNLRWVLIGGGLVYLVVAPALRPIREATGTAAKIEATADFSRRIPGERQPGEVGELVRTLNEL